MKEFKGLCLLLLILTVVSCKENLTKNDLIFVTRPGMGFDKWASIWVVKRHVASDTRIEWLAEGQNNADGGVLFDTEKALYKRTGRSSTFAALTEGFNVNVEGLPALTQLVHDIEINYWGPAELPYSDYVEHQFRQLQAKFGQEETPLNCYLAFFDRLEAQLPALQAMMDTQPTGSIELLPDPVCAERPLPATQPRQRLVSEWPVETVLKALQAKKHVVFIDVRESEEFAEKHIPSAINVKIRDLSAFDFGTLADADWIIPYCVKDFRGFEMARILKREGLANVVLMRPYGLKGWISVGLPTVGQTLDEQHALDALLRCAQNPGICLTSAKLS